MLTVMLKSLIEYDLFKSKLRSLWTKSKVVVLCYISFVPWSLECEAICNNQDCH